MGSGEAIAEDEGLSGNAIDTRFLRIKQKLYPLLKGPKRKLQDGVGRGTYGTPALEVLLVANTQPARGALAARVASVEFDATGMLHGELTLSADQGIEHALAGIGYFELSTGDGSFVPSAPFVFPWDVERAATTLRFAVPMAPEPISRSRTDSTCRRATTAARAGSCPAIPASARPRC